MSSTVVNDFPTEWLTTLADKDRRLLERLLDCIYTSLIIGHKIHQEVSKLRADVTYEYKNRCPCTVGRVSNHALFVNIDNLRFDVQDRRTYKDSSTSQTASEDRETITFFDSLLIAQFRAVFAINKTESIGISGHKLRQQILGTWAIVELLKGTAGDFVDHLFEDVIEILPFMYVVRDIASLDVAEFIYVNGVQELRDFNAHKQIPVLNAQPTVDDLKVYKAKLLDLYQYWWWDLNRLRIAIQEFRSTLHNELEPAFKYFETRFGDRASLSQELDRTLQEEWIEEERKAMFGAITTATNHSGFGLMVAETWPHWQKLWSVNALAGTLQAKMEEFEQLHHL